MFWNANALGLTSKGLTTKRVTALADLAARRKATQGQYFSPLSVSEQMWALVANAMNENERYSIVDNSVGSGRLLAFADPRQHQLFGCDVDERCINELSDDARAAGFNYEFSHSGMEDVSFNNISVALINPAFSITLQSPNLLPFASTNFGKFGPNTHALSNEYALDQALFGCSVVIALLPLSMRDFVSKENRLVAEIVLPSDAFKDEGANVRTAVYVFDSRKRSTKTEILRIDINKGDAWPTDLNLTIPSQGFAKAKWSVKGIDSESPVFTLPVTGNKNVGLHHHNKKIVLKFACALTQAKVENGLLRKEVEPGDRHRYAKNIKYSGQGQLLIDSYLQADDPQGEFAYLIEKIRQFGGKAVVSATLAGYFSKLVKRKGRDLTPFRKTVEQTCVKSLHAQSLRGMFLRKLDVSSPIIKKGELVEVTLSDGGYLLSKDNQEAFYSKNDFSKAFKVVSGESTTSADKRYEWNVIHEGKNHHYPDIYLQNIRRLEKSGVDFLWSPQRDAICELMMTKGAIAGWEQGTGKARGAIALALSSSAKYTLIVVEGGLVDEMAIELNKINLAKTHYNIIRSIEDIGNLAKINVISYTRLKQPFAQGKKTLSHLLRRRFGLVAADEGGILANPDSQQSRALLRLAARQLFVFDGTPIRSYPRDMLPIVSATCGETNLNNPFSLHKHTLTENILTSVDYNPRGIQKFKDDFIVLDWASHQFEEDLRKGAKREIPAIANVPAFRAWADSNVQRRLRNEPQWSPFTGIKRPTREYHDIEWDEEHLTLYIKEAVEFAHWYQTYKVSQDEKGKGMSLLTVLAKIQAVLGASNAPHILGERSAGTYIPATSKQRAVIERAKELIETTNDKIIIMASSPDVCERFSKLLGDSGIGSVLFTGKQNIKKRNDAMHNEYRHGDKRVLIMSSVGQRGLNLPQANRFLMYNRSWTSDREEQSIARMLRPDQLKQVFVEYFHLAGGIDSYQSNLIHWKRVAASTGLDYGENETQDAEFRHLDSILEQFCKDVLGESLYETHKRMCV